MLRLLACVLVLLAAATAGAAQSCRQALVLALDVSLSVNPHEFELQRRGLAAALLDTQVADALLVPGPPVELAIFEWSGQYDQALLVDWTAIDSRAMLRAVADTLIGRPQTLRSGRTGLGAAMRYARDMLATRTHCPTHTLDISGDGPNNNGVRPSIVKPEMAAAGITVNALVILNDSPVASAVGGGLVGYFRDWVVTGPAGFLETVAGFNDYHEAIRRKLLRELTPTVSLSD